MFRYLKHIACLCLLFSLSGCGQDHTVNHQSFTRIGQQHLVELVNEHEWVLIDVRNSNWFNGWPSDGTGIGGHIPGARNFDLHWLLNERSELNKVTERLFQSKGMRRAPGLVIYGSDDHDAEMLAEWLVLEQGFASENIRIYPFGFSGWLKSGEAVNTMPDYERLVTPEWLSDRLESDEPPILLDVSNGAGIRYRLSHIPGAIHFNTGLIESEPLWNVVAENKLRHNLLQLGITQNRQVVVYSDDMTTAARVLSVLEYAGVEDIRLLNGGFKAWIESGLTALPGWIEPVAETDFGDNGFSSVLVDIDRVKSILDNEDEHLISVRSWREYTGKASGYSYINARGRIPGAFWGHSGTDPYNMQDYLNPDGTMREFQDIADYWQKLSPDSETVMAFYCGTGWRASLSWFAARLMGFDNAVIYDGGWIEWSSDSRRPRDAG